MRWQYLALFGTLGIIGCFAIELDVNSEGHLLITRQEGFFVLDPASKSVKRIAAAAEGTEPQYARFSPDGKQVLTVTKAGFQTSTFSLVDIATGSSKQVFTIDTAANVRFSPDGKSLAVVAASKEDDKEFNSKVSELHLVSLPGGKSKLIAKRVGTQFKWLPDSKRILVVEAKEKIDDSTFGGTVSLIDVATGKSTPKAAVIGKQTSSCDVSPDGKTAVVLAIKMGKAGDKLDKGDAYNEVLHRLDLASGKVESLEIEPKYAFYSPSGKSLLLGMPPEGFSFDTVDLVVTPAGDVTEQQKVATANFPLALGGDGIVYAGWIGEDKIYYFVERKVYGTAGKSLQLMTAGVDGMDRQLLQPAIDQAAFE